MTLAITRAVSRRFNECELTYIDRAPIDLAVARQQHHEYVGTLKSLGCRVIELAEEPDLPDSVFVEDTAFILPEMAVITNPGAKSRKPETDLVAKSLSPFLPLAFIREPGVLDGGDVLVVGKDIFIGHSTRSNLDALAQVGRLTREDGYRAVGVEVSECLHLKSAATMLNESTLLINPRWVDPAAFKGYDLIEVDPTEPRAANCLPLNGAVIFPSSFPATRARIEAHDFFVRPVLIDELAKAEGAVSCCSLILPAR